MVDQCTFDGVEITQLGLSTSDYSAFKDALDDNLIISKSVHIGKGITESDTEYVYFVFDELRDYCLARYVLISSIKKVMRHILIISNLFASYLKNINLQLKVF